MTQGDYIPLVQELIEHFTGAVAQNLRGQRSKIEVGWRLLTGAKGALDTEKIVAAGGEFLRAAVEGWQAAVTTSSAI